MYQIKVQYLDHGHDLNHRQLIFQLLNVSINPMSSIMTLIVFCLLIRLADHLNVFDGFFGKNAKIKLKVCLVKSLISYLDKIPIQRFPVQLPMTSDQTRVWINFEQLTLFHIRFVADELICDVTVFT